MLLRATECLLLATRRFWGPEMATNLTTQHSRRGTSQHAVPDVGVISKQPMCATRRVTVRIEVGAIIRRGWSIAGRVDRSFAPLEE